MDKVKEITQKLVEVKQWPEFSAGDTITVTSYRHLADDYLR